MALLLFPLHVSLLSGAGAQFIQLSYKLNTASILHIVLRQTSVDFKKSASTNAHCTRFYISNFAQQSKYNDFQLGMPIVV